MPSQHSILAVDDEPVNLALLKHVLGDHYRMVFARSGREALQSAKRHRPALILLDIQMPDLDGYSVCRTLKADPELAEIPVIFTTTMSESVDEEAGFDAGGVDYLIKPLSPAVVRARVRTHLSLVKADQLERSYRDAIYMLGTAGHYNDNDTGVHIWRMAAYSRLLARAVAWPEEQCLLIELAAPMHDTGKIGIPDAILRKPGPLDATEWEIMRTHTLMGHEILGRSQAPVFQLAAEIALSHHEKWDGSGYPRGLAGESIALSARIVAVADVFDALTMQRPYKSAWRVEDAAQHIQSQRGTHFEPRLVDAFVEAMPELLAIKRHWDALEAQHAHESEAIATTCY